MVLRRGNLFDALPDASREERCETLLHDPRMRIERIVSQGQCSPAGFWYDQSQAEWVMLLRGSAVLRFEGDPEAIALEAGDWLEIPAHRRHRIEWTDPRAKTVWLAVFRDDTVSV